MSKRIVLLTGASSGIGREIARLLVAKGDFPLLVARNKDALKEIIEELGRGAAFSCNVTEDDQVEHLVNEVIRRWGRVDVLINNAGFGQFGGALELPIATYEKMIQTNFLGAVRFTHALLPHMLQQGTGRIVNIASTAGLTGVPNLAAYVASKFALIGFSESIHLEYAPQIQVGILCPGPVNTPFFAGENPARLFPPLIARKIISPQTAARHAVRLIDRPRCKVIPFSLAFGMRLRHLLPSLYLRITKMIYDQHFEKLSKQESPLNHPSQADRNITTNTDPSP